ncbi:MAG: transglycosylase SLT domain-containing protein, partial [Fibromonadaceae bacterium]|nr:transglycosylase SLT domain-containing protein [Fibromonadaceae bacterium]
EAVEALNIVSNTCQILAPLATEQLGDIAVRAQNFSQAMEFYNSTLGAAGLPLQYQEQLFAKIKPLVSKSVKLPEGALWIDEYRQWEQRQDLVVTKPKVVRDSLTMLQDRLWLRAWNFEMDKKYREAITNYRSIFGTTGKRTDEARHRHILCFYKLGEYDSAIVYVNAFRSELPNSSFIWAGMFWQGKAYAAQGKTEEAHRVWNEIVQLNPDDYHAHRVMQLMGMADSATGKYHAAPANAVQIPESEVRAWLDSIPPVSERKDLTEADSIALRRGAALLSVAQTDDAVFFLDNYLNNYPGNLLLQYDLASAYAIAGNIAQTFRPGQRLAWRIPTTHRGHIPLQVRTVIYPPLYSSTIRKYAEQFDIDPLFVTALMRQESMFNLSLVSPAGAIGLMQIMPATGRQIATELKVKNFATDSLYNPDLSIRFGVYYMQKRMKQFSNDLVLTLCAYNAGSHNAIKWRDRNRGVEFDIFVENIGFLETRIYVKRVLGNYWTYQRLVATPGYSSQ